MAAEAGDDRLASLAFPASTIGEGNYCDNCRAIDFSKAIAWAATCNSAQSGCVLATVTHFSTSCYLCAELQRTLQNLDTYAGTQMGSAFSTGTEFDILAFPMIDIGQWGYVRKDDAAGALWLQIRPSKDVHLRYQAALYRARARGFLSFQYHDTLKKIFRPQAVLTSFHADTVRRWIDTCQTRHDHQTLRQFLRLELTLIDCIDLTVCHKLVDQQYVALSYVWSKTNPTATTNVFDTDRPSVPLPVSELSKTIRDAVSTAKQLGFRYLWVDKYCVNQVDEGVKQHQIANMDSIYGGAALTLVAASGDDEHHGLAGVSVSRQQTLARKLGDFVLIREPADPVETISNSQWNTRGWTFQEELLSRRRLYFLPDQLFFECSKMECRESAGSSECCVNEKELDRYLYLYRLNITEMRFYSFRPRPPMEKLLEDRQDLTDLIETYTNLYMERELSLESDVLNAFAGVHKVIESVDSCPTVCLHGLPMLVNGSVDAAIYTLSRGLSWQTTRPRKNWRGLRFPSWSWAGWSRATACYQSFFAPEMCATIPIQEIMFHYDDGSSVTLEKALPILRALVQNHGLRELGGRDPSKPTAISFVAPTLPADSLRFNDEKDWSTGSYHSMLFQMYNPRSATDIFLGHPDPVVARYKQLPFSPRTFLKWLRRGEVACLVLAYGNDIAVTWTTVHVLLVRWRQPGEAVRIGKLTLWKAHLVDRLEEHIESLPRVDVRLW